MWRMKLVSCQSELPVTKLTVLTRSRYMEFFWNLKDTWKYRGKSGWTLDDLLCYCVYLWDIQDWTTEFGVLFAFYQLNSTEIFLNALPIWSKDFFKLDIVLNMVEQTGSKQSFHQMFSQKNLFQLLKKLPPLTICVCVFLAKLFCCFSVDTTFVSCGVQTWQALLSVLFFI